MTRLSSIVLVLLLAATASIQAETSSWSSPPDSEMLKQADKELGDRLLDAASLEVARLKSSPDRKESIVFQLVVLSEKGPKIACQLVVPLEELAKDRKVTSSDGSSMSVKRLVYKKNDGSSSISGELSISIAGGGSGGNRESIGLMEFPLTDQPAIWYSNVVPHLMTDVRKPIGEAVIIARISGSK